MTLVIYSKQMSYVNPGLDTYHQMKTFFWMLAIGVAIALLYDFFRALRKAEGKTHYFIVQVEDLLFIFCSFITLLLSAYILNEGEIRGYMLIAAALGVVFYYVVLSRFINKILYYILYCIIIAIKAPIRLLLLIIKKIKNSTRPKKE